VSISLQVFQQAIGEKLCRFPQAFADEKVLQELIAEVLHDLKIPFDRECALSSSDRPDFLICNKTIAVEVKKGKAGMAELRQVGRYLSHDGIKAVLFIANRFTERVPELIGKPIYYLDLWKFQF